MKQIIQNAGLFAGGCWFSISVPLEQLQYELLCGRKSQQLAQIPQPLYLEQRRRPLALYK